MKKKRLWQLLLGAAIVLSIVSYASNIETQGFVDSIIDRFTQSFVIPQEKVYLQTDKPYYNAGEDLWFKGYVVNAVTHEPNTLSRYLYVELINRSDSVLSRLKIRKDSLGFDGCIKLNPKLQPDYYTLRAYTYWMQNASSDFFFRKNVYIGNSIAERISADIAYGTAVNGEIPVSLTFKNTDKSPLVNKTIFISQSWSHGQRARFFGKTDSAGKIMFSMELDSADHSRKYMDVSINDDAFKYKNRFFVAEQGKDFDLQFFPEGGTLLANKLQLIAFKAIGSDGLSVEVSGTLFNSKNEEVGNFTSRNKGMGKFMFQSLPNENCYARVKAANGMEKRFNLPKAQEAGASIHVASNGSKVMFEVTNQTRISNQSLFLLVHCRGTVYVVRPLTTLSGKIAADLLPPGITSFSVIDSLGNPYCERLYFKQELAPPVVTMEADRSSYGKREPVNLKFAVKSLAGKPCAGNFSVSVTDNFSVKEDSTSDHILSYLLLSSDLKGYVEDPASYFRAATPRENIENLDLLMLTQGWKRFNISDIIKGTLAKPAYYLEVGQAISGKVKNLFGKPSVNCEVVTFSAHKNTLGLMQTDSLGRFLFSGIDFPDSTTFILKAKKRKSIADVEIIPDKDIFPKPESLYPLPRLNNEEASSAYLQQSREHYYNEGGMRVIDLEEVTVKASAPRKSKVNYIGTPDSEVSSDFIKRFSSMNVLSLMATVPGVRVSGTDISIRGGGKPLVRVDGFEVSDFSDLENYYGDDVENIAVFKGPSAAVYGIQGGNGVIEITLKDGSSIETVNRKPLSLVFVKPLGYAKPERFYVPKYEVDSIRKAFKPDLRTTIYWNPELQADSTGLLNVKFYTADKSHNYSVTLEGVTNNGQACRFVGALKRED